MLGCFRPARFSVILLTSWFAQLPCKYISLWACFWTFSKRRIASQGASGSTQHQVEVVETCMAHQMQME